jgi:hypothetical protein
MNPLVMPTETVDQLIEQLKRLKVQENVVLEKLSRAREHEREAQHRFGTLRNTTFVTDHAREHEKEAQHRIGTVRNTTFTTRDQVRITNAVKVYFTRSVNARDKTATVRYTKPYKEETKIFITTDNGLKTWRLEKHLREIQ